MEHFLNSVFDDAQIEIARLERQIQALAKPIREPYCIQKRLDAMQEYSDDSFRRRFRLSKQAVNYLYSLIGAELEPLSTRESFTISGLDKILITLRYYATASIHQVCGDFFKVSESSVCNIIPKVSEKIAGLRPQFIRMPCTDREIEQTKRSFFQIAGMPAIIGAIDGTLVKIQEVGGAQNKTNFFSRKQIYAINVQIVCDSNAMIEDIVARWPGCIHDETVFLNSSIFERFLRGEFIRNGRPSILLGDGGYKSEQFLATPLRQTNRERTNAEKMYQSAHISTRNVVERLNGQWKKRFPCLWIGMRFRKLDTVLNVIVATAVLHNICKMRGDHLPPPLSPDEEARYDLAEQNAQQQNAHPQQNNNNNNNTIASQFLKNYFDNRVARM